MEKNILELIVGKTYIIDKTFRNGGEVVLVHAGTVFCRVRDPKTNAEWNVMQNRLSEKEISE